MLKKHKPVSGLLLCPVGRTSQKSRQEWNKDGRWARLDSLFFLPPGDIFSPREPWQRPESYPHRCPHDWTGLCRHRWASWPKKGFLRGSMVPSQDSEDPHTFHPALNPFSLFAPTLGFHWNSRFSSAKCLREWKKLWGPGLKSYLLCELVVCPWARYFPLSGPQLSLYKCPPDQYCQGPGRPPHSPSPRPGITSQWWQDAASESFLTQCPK